MELYVHFPFCRQKCRYCDFLSFGGKEECFEPYIGALLAELDSYRELVRTEPLETVFIGGGTPSVLPASQAERLLKGISALISEGGMQPSEYTIEANPGTLDKEKLGLYKSLGVNRLSIGLQSADDAELKMLGRIHDLKDFISSFDLAREAGFDNINIDLMSALPGQNASSWERSLRFAADAGPEHISAYSLIIEPGTPFFEIYGEGEPKDAPPLPDEDEERRMYRMTGQILEEYGFGRYEISNYARPGYESKHNLGYWTGKNYIGAGLGASSYICRKDAKERVLNSVRFKNSEVLEEYINSSRSPAQEALSFAHEGVWKKPVCCSEASVLEKTELIGEYVILHLRLTEGFSEEEFQKLFGQSPGELFKDVINKYIRMGFMERKDGFLRLTEDGFDVANTIMADFI